MRILTLASLALCLAVLPLACDEPTGEGNGDNTNGDENGEGEEDDNDGGGGDLEEGTLISATGSVNGNDFDISCDEAYYEQTGLSSLRQCQAGGLHTIQCRAADSNVHDVDGQLVVVVALVADGDDAVAQDDFFTTVKMGGTLQAQLDKNSTNNTAHTITIDNFERDTRVKGSFTATWSNPSDGSDYGTVSGAFDYPCPTE